MYISQFAAGYNNFREIASVAPGPQFRPQSVKGSLSPSVSRHRLLYLQTYLANLPGTVESNIKQTARPLISADGSVVLRITA